MKAFHITPRSAGAKLALTLLLGLFLTAGSCGPGDEEVDTDPGAGTDIDLPAETVPDPGFDSGGDGLGGGDVDTGDVAVPTTSLEYQHVFFDYDSSDLDAEDREALANNARILRENPTARVLIEGHCDERGTVQYNLALGERRAKQARDYLVNLGVSANRIDIVSYGKERPFATGSGEANWSQNRRAHFVAR